MALTFPRELPHHEEEDVVRATFTLVDAVRSSASHTGSRINRTRTADPTWTLDFEMRPLSPEEKRPWTAWKNSLRGGLRLFIASDITRLPGGYPNAKASQDVAAGWSGIATLSSLGASGLLGLSGLPAGYRLRVGDRIGIEQSGHYGYYEVDEDVNASGTGAASVTVSPFLHTRLFSVGALARLWLPKAKFVLDWQSWQDDGGGAPSPISFRATQQVF